MRDKTEYLEIEKTTGEQIIVRKGNGKPIIYNSLTSFIVDEFHPSIKKEFSGDKLTLYYTLNFNPPTAA